MIKAWVKAMREHLKELVELEGEGFRSTLDLGRVGKKQG